MPSEPSAPSIVVPIEYAGKWIAWNLAGTRIVASGRTLEETALAAQAAGETQPVFAKVPKADVRFIGPLLLSPAGHYNDLFRRRDSS